MEQREGPGAERVAAFSDGVFAIAITLLMIEIAVSGEEVQGDRLNEALEDLLPQFFSFVFSFLVIGRYWIAHNLMLGHASQADAALLWLNLFFLLCIAFLPFPTALLGEHLDEAAAVVVYAAAMCATGITSSILWSRISRANKVDPGQARHVQLRAASIPLVFGLSIPAAFVDLGAVTLATALWIIAIPVGLAILATRRRAAPA